MTDDLAWAAGLFEGEGCITRGRNSLPIIHLAMTDRDVVERFAVVVRHGTIVELAKYRERPHYQRQWRWACQREEHVRDVMARLLPWLGNRRRARWEEILAARAEAVATMIDRVSCSRCGRFFYPDRTQNRRQHFCSVACQREARNETRRAGVVRAAR